MSPGIAFEAAKDAAETLGPATDPLLFAAAAALVLAIVLLLLLGGRVHRGTDAVSRKTDAVVFAREVQDGGPDA